MKRRDPGSPRRSPKKPLHPFPHFIGCLIGKGDGKDVPWVHPFFLNEIGDPVSQDSGLSTSGPCKNKERPFGFQDRFLLNGVEIVEKRHGKCVNPKFEYRSSKAKPKLRFQDSKRFLFGTFQFGHSYLFRIDP
jgi:hypothetical protein